jgi:hypothetical protein
MVLKLDINVKITHMIFWHQALHHNETYNFAFNHDHKFWFILIIKNVITIQYNIITKFKKTFEWYNTCGPFYEVY